MKNVIIVFILLFATFKGFSQLKSPTSINQIKEFTGVILYTTLFEGEYAFTINDYKLGKITFYFRTDGKVEDPYRIECKIPEELDNRLISDDVKGIKVKVKAKSAYGYFFNYADKPNFKSKRIIWRPFEITRIR